MNPFVDDAIAGEDLPLFMGKFASAPTFGVTDPRSCRGDLVSLSWCAPAHAADGFDKPGRLAAE
ncbi:Uncharacterised protein [Mycobacteroides abscessus subsp. abscessus]|nr:Uncharacterised protein [Mycobacteroides abscessus subsp. abscessus]